MTYQQKLIDVSKWQGRIDWDKVKAAGYHAIIRCGYGSDIASQDDEYFELNVAECEVRGIPYGVYLYSYADTQDKAISEAYHAKRLIELYCGDYLKYPVFLDVEESKCADFYRNAVYIFCSTMESWGYKAGYYTFKSAYETYLKDQGLDGYAVWIAHWGVSYCDVPCDIWQYTDDGHVPGVNGACDLNYCFTDYAGGGGDADMTIGDAARADVIDFLVYKTLCDAYGIGDKRRSELGDFYDEVQAKINALIGK